MLGNSWDCGVGGLQAKQALWGCWGRECAKARFTPGQLALAGGLVPWLSRECSARQVESEAEETRPVRLGRLVHS